MNKLNQLRNIIASLDETLVRALCNRAKLKLNCGIYNTERSYSSIAEIANLFGGSATIAGRAHIIHPVYINNILPLLCEPGVDEDCRKCLSTDSSCMNALVQRLNLSVHVATLKKEEIPDALRKPIELGDPVLLEAAITNQAVENEVIKRILETTRVQLGSDELQQRVATLYAEWVIPISRKIQVHDLLI
jgi:chorismate mutase